MASYALTIARSHPGLIAPWYSSARADYFRNAEHAQQWAEHFGGTVSSHCGSWRVERDCLDSDGGDV